VARHPQWDRPVLITPAGSLRGFQRLAALQATRLAAWSDQPAKRAHPLRHETPILRRCRCRHFGEPIPKPSAQTVAEAMKVGCHCSTLYSFSRQVRLFCTGLPSRSAMGLRRHSLMVKHDRPAPTILCRIAHLAQQSQSGTGKSLRSQVVDHLDMSNSDQLSRNGRAIIVVETSIFSLFQVL